jgi:predicted permease
LAAEFSVALVLVAAAGLLVNSYRHLQAVDLGIRAGRVLTARIHVPLTPAWQPNAARRGLLLDLVEAARTLPSVTAAGAVQRLPLDAVRGGVDLWRASDPAQTVRALPQTASEEFFEAIGARLLGGRAFAPTDTEQTPPVVIINDVLAAMLWPGESAIGKRVTYDYFRGDITAEVIGLVSALRYEGLRADLRPEFYRSYRQTIVAPSYLVVRTSADPLALLPEIRARLARIDPSRTVTLADASTLAMRQARVSARPRFYLIVFGSFAAIAFVLSAFGIHGTMAFWMRERWREMGIRMALGASRRELAGLLVRRGVGLALTGVAAGLAVAAAGGRFMESLLFHVRPTDAPSLAIAVLLLAGLAFVICLALARRFSALDPAATLRVE